MKFEYLLQLYNILSNFVMLVKTFSIPVQICGHFRMDYLLFNETDERKTVLNSDFGFARVIAMQYTIDKTLSRNPNFLLGDTLKVTYFNGLRLKTFTDVLLSSCDFLIGPYSSYETENAVSLFGPLGYSMISHGASSNRFQNRHYFKNVFRTVPDNEMEADLLTRMSVQYKWQYVGIFSTENDGAVSLKNLFQNKMNSIGHCIPVDKTLKDNYNRLMYLKIFNQTIFECFNKNVKVLFLILSQKACYSLYMAMEDLTNKTKKILQTMQIVMSSNCGTNIQIKESMEPYLMNMVTVQPLTKLPKDFKEYFKNKTKTLGKPFDQSLRTYWNMFHDCDRHEKNCNKRNNSTINNHLQIASTIEATRIALNIIRQSLKACADKSDEIEKYRCKRSSEAKIRRLNYLNSLREKTPLMDVHFNLNGGVSTSFEIFQLQKQNEDYEFIKIGNWNYKHCNNPANECLRINVTLKTSMCSKECKINEVKEFASNLCCWTCVVCSPKRIIENNKCVSCNTGYEADGHQKKCLPLQVYSMSPSEWMSIVVLFISTLGLVFTFFILGIYIKYYSTKVIKASSRELSLFTLAGIFLMLITPMMFVQRPTPAICGIQKILFGLSLTCCYAPLVLKTNRIYRIFLSSQKFKLKKLLLVSMTSQFSIIAGMLGMQTVMGIFWIISDQPFIKITYDDVKGYGTETCYSSEMTMGLNIGFPLVLMIASTFWAFKTRNLPETFSEMKSIGVTMYITLFLCMAALAIVFVLNGQHGVKFIFSTYYVMCLLYHSIAIVTLIGQYASKIKLVCGKKEKFDTTIDTTDFTSVSTNRYTTATIVSPNLSDARKVNIRTNHHTIAHASPTTNEKRRKQTANLPQKKQLTLSPPVLKQMSVQL